MVGSPITGCQLVTTGLSKEQRGRPSLVGWLAGYSKSISNYSWEEGDGRYG